MGGAISCAFDAPTRVVTRASANSNVVPGPRDVMSRSDTTTRSSR